MASGRLAADTEPDPAMERAGPASGARLSLARPFRTRRPDERGSAYQRRS